MIQVRSPLCCQAASPTAAAVSAAMTAAVATVALPMGSAATRPKRVFRTSVCRRHLGPRRVRHPSRPLRTVR